MADWWEKLAKLAIVFLSKFKKKSSRHFITRALEVALETKDWNTVEGSRESSATWTGGSNTVRLLPRVRGVPTAARLKPIALLKTDDKLFSASSESYLTFCALPSSGKRQV
jgi:hypothetical protein